MKRVQAEGGGEPKTLVLPLDVTRAEDLSIKPREALAIFAGIDILVLNAGISQRSLTRDTDESVYRRLMEVNFFVPQALTRAVLHSMFENKIGHIVVI